MQLESYMGASVIPHMSSGQGSAIAYAKMQATLFTSKEFPFDRSAGLADEHVAEYSRLAAADRAAGTYEASMTKLLSFVIATRDALKARLSRQMTDRETADVVGIIGRMNLVLEITAQNFPGGIPGRTASEVDNYTKEINDLTTQLVNKRTSDFSSVVKSYNSAVSAEQSFNVKAQEYQAQQTATAPTTGAGTVTSESYVPGGGAAGSAGEIVDAGGQPVIEKTAAQKYGPVAALVAGGIAAYFALR